MTRSALLAFIVAASVGLASIPVQAQPNVSAAVAQARSHGLVGERFDGYLGLVGSDDPVLRHAVASINIRRRALYGELSDARGVTLQEVGLTAACQLLATVAVGERYLSSDNVWQARAPGQPAPVPAYCR